MNFEPVAASILVVLVSFIGATLVKGVRVMIAMVTTVEQLVERMGTKYPPEGVLGALHELDTQVQQQRDWLLRHGFDRREPNQTGDPRD